MTKVLLFFLGLFSASFVAIALFSTFSQNKNITPLVFNSPTVVSANQISEFEYFRELNISDIFRLHSTFSMQEDDISLIMTGDIIPARVTDNRIRKNGAYYPFRKTLNILSDADLTITNLESPLISKCPVHLEGMKFCGQPEFAKAMRNAGIDVVGIENNHIGNYGVNGIEETKKYISESSMSAVALDTPVYKNVKGTVFGIVAINMITSRPVDKAALEQMIKNVKSNSNIVVVLPHWGREYSLVPKSAPGISPDDPIALGRFMIDSGADLVLGNHPHWVQGVEQYNNGFIAYAHGNFIFDQEWSRETKEGVVGQYIFSRNKLVDVSYKAVIIEDYSTPRLATDEEAIKILERMKQSSELLQ
jgi:poly-gamma-glutamate synthesis protein (capsule biosynthesis protein)